VPIVSSLFAEIVATWPIMLPSDVLLATSRTIWAPMFSSGALIDGAGRFLRHRHAVLGDGGGADDRSWAMPVSLPMVGGRVGSPEKDYPNGRENR